MDKDAQMLEKMGNAVIDLQVKYRASNLTDRITIKPILEELLTDYARYQMKLLKEGLITTDEDLEEMAQIKLEIDKAANKEATLKAIARGVAFIAMKI